MSYIIASPQEVRIEKTEAITGQTWAKYYVGCSENESLIGLAVNQLREMCFGLKDGLFPVDCEKCREGFFNGKTLQFVQDRKSFINCLPKSYYENYQLLCTQLKTRELIGN